MDSPWKVIDPATLPADAYMAEMRVDFKVSHRPVPKDDTELIQYVQEAALDTANQAMKGLSDAGND